MIPHGVATLDPRGMIVRIYVGEHYALQHAKYLSRGPQYFRGQYFLKFPHDKSMGARDHHSVANLDTRDILGRVYVGDH